jgi:hypothetical protein
MSCTIKDSQDVTDICKRQFKKASAPGTVVTRDTPLRPTWSDATIQLVFMKIEDELRASGCGPKSITGSDLDDPDKVGKTVGSLADHLFDDLTDAATSSYLRGYRDASRHMMQHVLTHFSKRGESAKLKGKRSPASKGKKRSAKKLS